MLGGIVTLMFFIGSTVYIIQQILMMFNTENSKFTDTNQ